MEERTIHQGSRVVLLKGHPWATHSGTVIGEMNTAIGFMWKVRLDTGGIEVGAKPGMMEIQRP